MAHNWPEASAATKAKLLTVTRPVNETFKHLERLFSMDAGLSACGESCLGLMPRPQRRP
jgi:hypothetical protein